MAPQVPKSPLPTWPKSCRATQILSTDTRKRAGRFQEQITKSAMNSLNLSLYRNRIRTWDMNLGSMLARPRLRLFLPSLLSPGGPANNQVVKLPVGPARQIYAPGKIIQRKICLIWRWSKAQKQCKSLGCQTIKVIKRSNFEETMQISMKTLPKALRTQALTALTKIFGFLGLVRWVWLGRFG